MRKTNVLERFQCGKYLVAYVLNTFTQNLVLRRVERLRQDKWQVSCS